METASHDTKRIEPLSPREWLILVLADVLGRGTGELRIRDVYRAMLRSASDDAPPPIPRMPFDGTGESPFSPHVERAIQSLIGGGVDVCEPGFLSIRLKPILYRSAEKIRARLTGLDRARVEDFAALIGKDLARRA